ncbi:MAG: glycosyltransferase family 4 protein [Spirosoma sp.]|nr:glycosyltransferase family 4 protein [Spirosoma sp.]
MTKKLFVDTERMSNLTSGLGQVCLHLGLELVRKRPPGWEITFLVPPEQIGVFGPSVSYIVAKWWHRWWRPWQFDVWHCLHQGSQILPMWAKVRLIYTVLDLNFLSLPQYSNQRKKDKKKHYQRCIDRAAAVTTISVFVAQDVRQQLVIPNETPIEVIYCGIDTPATRPETYKSPLLAEPSLRPGGPFLLFVGFLQPYKNVHTMLPLLVAFPQYQLVLAGPDNPAYREQILAQAQQLGVTDRLILPGPVDEATKWWLYAHCDAFLFPSLHEGFGLPVAEAMSFGKPVFSSASSSLPEVGGTEAIYFPDFTPDTVVNTFRRGMETYRNDPTMPERLRHQSKKFSWATAAAEYWALYGRVL